MKVKVVTALFDINRDIKGDGRKLEDYLKWISDTLRLKSDFVIFTEEKFYDHISDCRKNSPYKTDIIVQKLEEIPFYKNIEKIKKVFLTEDYKSKIKDPSRIECYLPEYNIIQYSKFGWIEESSKLFEDSDYFIWMDAGCSRFFENYNYIDEWPDKSKLISNKIQIQGNANFQKFFLNLDESIYMWENNSILVGTLFGIHRSLIDFVVRSIDDIFDSWINSNCVNNEQILLAVFAKKYLDKISILLYNNDYTHLPFFKYLKK